MQQTLPSIGAKNSLSIAKILRDRLKLSNRLRSKCLQDRNLIFLAFVCIKSGFARCYDMFEDLMWNALREVRLRNSSRQ
jgi:hypothetical protein